MLKSGMFLFKPVSSAELLFHFAIVIITNEITYLSLISKANQLLHKSNKLHQINEEHHLSTPLECRGTIGKQIRSYKPCI